MERFDDGLADANAGLVASVRGPVRQVEAAASGDPIGVLHVKERVAGHRPEFSHLGDLIADFAMAAVLATGEILPGNDSPDFEGCEGRVEPIAIRGVGPRRLRSGLPGELLLGDLADGLRVELRRLVVPLEVLEGSLGDFVEGIETGCDVVRDELPNVLGWGTWRGEGSTGLASPPGGLPLDFPPKIPLRMLATGRRSPFDQY